MMRVGAVADAMVKGSKIAGDFATQQISLRDVMTKATGAIRANWNAIILFAAGGAVIAGISAITAALGKMREEAEAVAKAIQAARDALNKFLALQQNLWVDAGAL